MFNPVSPVTPEHAAQILGAARAAGRAIPPAFPLDATVAVNPFLGQAGLDLAAAMARLGRVAGVGLGAARAAQRTRLAQGEISEADLAGALDACAAPGKPGDVAALRAALAGPGAAVRALPTVADLAAVASGTDWPALTQRCIGAWAAGHFDRGQALWTPAPGLSAFAAWRAWACHDLTPEIAGLGGFCAHVAACPDTPERAILRAAEALGLDGAAAESAFHRLLIDLGGWAQHGRWLGWQAERAGGQDGTLTDLLAIRLVWEEALLAAGDAALATAWRGTLRAHAAPAVADAALVADAILQDAAERAHQRALAAVLTGAAPGAGRPALQAAFCIDVRSEVFRRALEAVDPGIETFGFAGFFGLAAAYRAPGSDVVEDRLPVLLPAALAARAEVPPQAEAALRIRARAARAWGRFRQAAVSSFAFVEAAGPLYAAKLVQGALGLGPVAAADPVPAFAPELAPGAKIAAAAAILRAMSMTERHARLVLLVGHGAALTNNPAASGYRCGACGGHSGEVSARLLAGLLNDADVRAGLAGTGIVVPQDTLFVAGLHDTVSDQVTLYRDTDSPGHEADLAQAETWLSQAGAQARAERARRLPGASGPGLAARGRDWAEVRPEWGLAGCAAFIAAPRAATKGRDLGGRAFLHSYDWRADPGFGVLELILTAPVVVASWISLQYFGSVVAPGVFGGGNKLIHNVTGGIGVVEGNGGRLRAGLPWQAVHDGAGLAHDPLRLSVLVEAPQGAIADILARHPGVQALFDQGWLHLLALEDGRIVARYRPGPVWQAMAA